MIDEELKSKIIRNLAKHRTRNFIVTGICETTGMKWNEAESLVDKIEEDNSLEIYSRQKPFMIILGSTIAVGGLILFVFIIFFHPAPFHPGSIISLGTGLGMFIGGSRSVIKLLMD